MIELFFSTDIETNGPIPIENSMLSFGTAVFHPDGNLIDTFSANLETLPFASENHDTMVWWKKNIEAYRATRQNTQDPKTTMEDYVAWINKICKDHNANPVFVAYPATFDFLFIYTYLIKFVGKSPFSFSALDIKTYAMAMLKTPYRQSTKKHMPKHWFSDTKHTHNALEDAIEQGQLFINMWRENTCKQSVSKKTTAATIIRN